MAMSSLPPPSRKLSFARSIPRSMLGSKPRRCSSARARLSFGTTRKRPRRPRPMPASWCAPGICGRQERSRRNPDLYARLLKLDRQHFAKTAGAECGIMAELHAGDGAAALSAVEGGRLTEAVRAGERAPLGEAAARRDGKGGSSLPVFVVRKPIARHTGTRDRRDQQLRVRVLGG